jgi:hypothetical protein
MNIYDFIRENKFIISDSYIVDDIYIEVERTHWDIYEHEHKPLSIHVASIYDHRIYTENGIVNLEELIDLYYKSMPLLVQLPIN